MAIVKNITTGRLALIERRPAGSKIGTPDIQRILNPSGADGDSAHVPDNYASGDEIKHLVETGRVQVSFEKSDTDAEEASLQYAVKTEFSDTIEELEFIATRAHRKSMLSCCQEVLDGVDADEIMELCTWGDKINSIMAFVASTGAPAAKMLLVEDADYSFTKGAKTVTILTNQIGNRLVVNYKLSN